MVYGTNVAISIALATLLVVALNWIGQRSATRWHLTALGSYRLSEQTRRVLKGLDGAYRVVAMTTPSEQGRRLRDLLEEYAREQPALSVEYVNPTREPARVDAVLASLRERHAGGIEGVRRSIDAGLEELASLGKRGAVFASILEEAAATPSPPTVERTTADLARTFARFEREFSQLARTLRAEVDQPLPAYESVRSRLEKVLTGLDEQFAVAGQALKRHVESKETPAPVQERYLRLMEGFVAVHDRLTAASASLARADRLVDYHALRARLMNPAGVKPVDSVLILSPGRVAALQLDGDIFVASERSKESGDRAEYRFQGEERVTGAIISLARERMPLVVFVTTDQATPWRGNHASQTFNHVRDRLERMNFEVTHWNPILTSQQGQQTKSTAPVPASGQRAVWVVIPPELPRGASDMLAAGRGQQEVARHLSQRLALGDGALVMTHFVPRSSIIENNPLIPLVRSFGIDPKTDQLLMQERQVSKDRTRVEVRLETQAWPASSPLTPSVTGLSGSFFAPSPIELDAASEARPRPLATVEGPRIWAEIDPARREYNPAQAQPSFIVGALAEARGGRLAVVTDKVWASDALTTAGEVDGQLVAGGAYLAGVGARFPANTELFVNGVCWLAGLEDLLARTARTQDVPRVRPLSGGERRGLMAGVVVGVPSLVALAGVGVWIVRRRG